jgi:hypothetical protein
MQHFQALSNQLKTILFIVMAGQEREARLRPNDPAIHVLFFDRADAL